MATGSVSKQLKMLRLLAGVLFIIVGTLILAAGLAGPEPIRISTGGHRYYQLVANPPPHPMAIGAIGVLLGVVLICLPALLGKRGR